MQVCVWEVECGGIEGGREERGAKQLREVVNCEEIRREGDALGGEEVSG